MDINALIAQLTGGGVPGATGTPKYRSNGNFMQQSADQVADQMGPNQPGGVPSRGDPTAAVLELIMGQPPRNATFEQRANANLPNQNAKRMRQIDKGAEVSDPVGEGAMIEELLQLIGPAAGSETDGNKGRVTPAFTKQEGEEMVETVRPSDLDQIVDMAEGFVDGRWNRSKAYAIAESYLDNNPEATERDIEDAIVDEFRM